MDKIEPKKVSCRPDLGIDDTDNITFLTVN